MEKKEQEFVTVGKYQFRIEGLSKMTEKEFLETYTKIVFDAKGILKKVRKHLLKK